MRAVIRVDGIAAEGRHGANPGERQSSQPFVVDVEIDVDVGEDRLEGTIDYGVVADTVRQAVAANSFELLETLAQAVGRAVYGLPVVERVTVVVHKPKAAEIVGADDVSVQTTVG